MFWNRRKKPFSIVQSYIAALNDHDAAAMISLLHPDACLVDSRGACVAGYEDSVEAVHAFLALDAGFQMHIDSYAMHGDDVLMRGSIEADDPRLATNTLWMARVQDGKLRRWQSFGNADSVALAHILVPDKAHREEVPMAKAF